MGERYGLGTIPIARSHPPSPAPSTTIWEALPRPYFASKGYIDWREKAWGGPTRGCTSD